MIEDSRVEKEKNRADEQKKQRKKARKGVQKKPLSENNINTDAEEYVLSENEKSWT